MNPSLHVDKSMLGPEELRMLQKILAETPRLKRAFLFGSRAKGVARSNSDIDLAVEGLTSDLQVEELALRLDQLPLPYKIDVLAMESIKNAALRGHVHRVGLLVFDRT